MCVVAVRAVVGGEAWLDELLHALTAIDRVKRIAGIEARRNFMLAT